MGITLSKENLEQFIEKITNEVELAKKSVVTESENKDVLNIHRGRVSRLDTFAKKAFSFKKATPSDQEEIKSTVVDIKSVKTSK